MNEPILPILPDLPEGFYLATGDGEGSRVYERCNGKWTNEYGVRCEDPRRMPWHGYTLHAIPALLSAAGERDALAICLHDEKTERARESRESIAIRRGMEAENYLLKERRTELSERAEKAEKERDALKVSLDEALSVLMEWQYDDRGYVCLSCHYLRGEGHSPTCSLAAVLAKAKP